MKEIDENKKEKITRPKKLYNYTIFIKNGKNENKITSLTRLYVSYKKTIADKKYYHLFNQRKIFVNV